ncbi:saccharopine dehydrogenase family protein [Streptomyces yaizuensis]|uniref:Saccharopine dehydrogenase n=1 Tax=Streptomyces yaizuensis TaxID=2989713 RepID=A0ABQ5NXP2_9ACTN|nr:saccharopine dehydrogenase [Streptomyces sp. YSPA8]GLF94955.1 saccharopine dehydrogenase [Streptomyces sp. YSPA8]
MNTDQLMHDPDGPVLLVGGYGTVGTEFARAAHGRWPLLLAGRSPGKAADLCREVSAEARRWDLADPEPFRAAVRAVVSLVNDPDDRVLRASLAAGVPYVDVTRWTARVQRAALLVSVGSPTAPALLSSGWMGGVVPLVAAVLAGRVGGAESVDTAIRYDLADRSGADSVEFMDRLGVDFEVLQDGRDTVVSPLSGARTLDIGPDRTKVVRIDTPEQFTLPLTLGARTVTTRLGFSSASTTSALVALGRTGFFRRARGEFWRPLRRRILHSPGEGGTATVRIEVRGPGGALTATVTDARGQSHMTAVGGLLGLRRVLGDDGAPAPGAGLALPEAHPLPETVLSALAAEGVVVDIVPSPAASSLRAAA